MRAPVTERHELYHYFTDPSGSRDTSHVHVAGRDPLDTWPEACRGFNA